MGLDPQYLYDNSDVIWYGTEGYSNALNALMKVTGKSEEAVNYMLRGQYGAADFWTASQALEDYGVVAAYNTNGYRCFAFADKVTETVPTGPMYQLDSNATATTVVKAAPVYDVYVDDVAGSATEGKVLVDAVGNNLPSAHAFKDWKFYAGNAIQAIGAVGTGISLGKFIDSTLYNLNPDFWDANGMKNLNPDTWNTITMGDDSPLAGLVNLVLGLDPNSGKSQLFIDQNALAYMAMYMNLQGVFNRAETTYTIDDTSQLNYPTIYQPVNIVNGVGCGSVRRYYADNLSSWMQMSRQITSISGVSDFVIVNTINPNGKPYSLLFSKTHPSSTCYYKEVTLRESSGETTERNVSMSLSWSRVSHRTSISNVEYWFSSSLGSVFFETYSTNELTPIGFSYYPNTLAITYGSSSAQSAVDDIAEIVLCGTQHEQGGVDGIGSQEGATLPDTSTWVDLPSTLQSLQNQYPSMFNDAVPNTIVQPDGSTQVITYVPIAMPNANGQWDAQPTSSTTSQTNPEVEPLPDPTTENNDLLKLILQLITMPEPKPDTQTETETTPQPPIPDLPTTGEGSSPTPTAPTGSASALWSVYHPTQAQINSFGAWLWGSVFTTDIRKLFEDPIQGVIKLHKVFATPVDSGTGNIVVGTLDSGVSSATVNQQYVEVDCGSVSCEEVFGTVFDYPPFTEVSLYLPFIGIVSLDVNDVMRSTIHVTYGVDVFTGACLAVVEVIRDGNDVVMYQYSGVCSVDYPLTNLQASQMAAGLLGVAAGIAGLASGGTLTPALGLAGGAVATMKRNVGRSGSFSGNSGAMGIKIPYLIFQRPQPKTATTFPRLSGYPTNYSCKLGDCSNHVVVKHVHVEGIPATDTELSQIEALLKDGVLI